MAARGGGGRGGRAAPRVQRLAPARGRQGLARGRVRPAQPDVRAPALAGARVLRRAADGSAHVALDRRPPGRALLPRLRPHLHPAVRAHDPDRIGRDAGGRPVAGGRVARADAVRDLGGVPLRTPQPAGHPGGAAADRGADRGRRGEHLRRARGQGVRPGGAPAAPLQPLGGAGVRPVDGLHAAARLLLAVHRLPPPARPGGPPVRWRPAGDQRADQRRRVRSLLRLRADAHRADADARHRARDGPARRGERRARVRDPRHRAHPHRAAGRARTARPAAGAWSFAA